MGRQVRKNYRRASLISRKNRQFGYYPITRGPEPVSSIVSSRLRLHCTQSLPSLADKRNLQWQVLSMPSEIRSRPPQFSWHLRSTSPRSAELKTRPSSNARRKTQTRRNAWTRVSKLRDAY